MLGVLANGQARKLCVVWESACLDDGLIKMTDSAADTGLKQCGVVASMKFYGADEVSWVLHTERLMDCMFVWEFIRCFEVVLYVVLFVRKGKEALGARGGI
ncbi:hypothetical protein Peur_026400 [Populus x canadensis]